MFKKTHVILMSLIFTTLSSVRAENMVVSEEAAESIASACYEERVKNIRELLTTASSEKNNSLDEEEQKFKQCVSEKLQEKSKPEHHTALYTIALAGIGAIGIVGGILGACSK